MKLVPNPPGGNIHDYVPFYFAPRSPMLAAIHNGNVGGCSFRQEDIAHLETTVGKVIEMKAEFVFYDLNATLDYSKPFTDLDKLQTEIAWELLTEAPQLDGFCKYFFNNHNNEKHVDRITLDKAVQKVNLWSQRKSRLMKREHIQVAWDRLIELSWI